MCSGCDRKSTVVGSAGAACCAGDGGTAVWFAGVGMIWSNVISTQPPKKRKCSRYLFYVGETLVRPFKIAQRRIMLPGVVSARNESTSGPHQKNSSGGSAHTMYRGPGPSSESSQRGRTEASVPSESRSRDSHPWTDCGRAPPRKSSVSSNLMT